MKSLRLLVLVMILCLTLGPKLSIAAPDEYDDSQSNPFRIAAYLLNPAGFILEWTVFRPFHFLVSSTCARRGLLRSLTPSSRYLRPPALSILWSVP